MRAFAADVGDGCYEMAGQFFLYVQVPLLNVRPNGLVRDGSDVEREQKGTADIAVAIDIELRGVEGERGGAFEGLRVGFVTVGMLEENSVAATDGHFAVALRIPGETDAGSRIEEMTLHTAGFLVGANVCG